MAGACVPFKTVELSRGMVSTPPWSPVVPSFHSHIFASIAVRGLSIHGQCIDVSSHHMPGTPAQPDLARTYFTLALTLPPGLAGKPAASEVGMRATNVRVPCSLQLEGSRSRQRLAADSGQASMHRENGIATSPCSNAWQMS